MRLAREALKTGAAAPTILNAANEVAVAAFLGGHIGFLEIARIVEKVLDQSNATGVTPANLDEIYEIDRIARVKAEDFVQNASR